MGFLFSVVSFWFLLASLVSVRRICRLESVLVRGRGNASMVLGITRRDGLRVCEDGRFFRMQVLECYGESRIDLFLFSRLQWARVSHSGG